MPFRKHIMSLIREQLPQYLGSGAAYVAGKLGDIGLPKELTERGLDYVLDKLHSGVVEKRVQRAVTAGIGEIDAIRARQRMVKERQSITGPYYGDPFVGMGNTEAPETGMAGLNAPYTYHKRQISRTPAVRPTKQMSGLVELIDEYDEPVTKPAKKLSRAQVLAKARAAKATKAKNHKLVPAKKTKPKRKVSTVL